MVHPPFIVVSIRSELATHLVIYCLHLILQLTIGLRSQNLFETTFSLVFPGYLIYLFVSLLLAIQAYRVQAYFLLIPVFVAALFDMCRFLFCALSMIIKETHFLKEGFLIYHKEKSHLWAVVYTILFLYFYWAATTFIKVTMGSCVRRREEPLPLIIADPSLVIRNMDSPPRYQLVAKKEETPPPRYTQLI